MSVGKQEEELLFILLIFSKFWNICKKFVNRLKHLLRIKETSEIDKYEIGSFINEHNIRKNKRVSKRIVNKLKHLLRINETIEIDKYKIGSLVYKCNICGNKCVSILEKLHREVPSCESCGSNVRFRSLIHLLSMELFGKSLNLKDFPIRKDISGIGFSDWEGFAVKLTNKLNFKNTYLHKKPKLDITQVDQKLWGTFDFIIASELFEHVIAPVSIAIKNTFNLLKEGGILILTVPYRKEGMETIEHFKDLHDYKLLTVNGKKILKNKNKEGLIQIYDNLIFHGGDGQTMEMRMFCENSILKELKDAGFSDIRIYKENYFHFGIYWQVDYHLPIIARKISC